MDVTVIYDDARRQARKAAQDDLQEQIALGLFERDKTSGRHVDLRIGPIDDHALDAWSSLWDGHADRRYDWDWRIERSGWQTTLRRVDAAIWADGILCGMLIGMPTKGRSFLRIDLLEGCPDPRHPLKGRITHCAATVADAFGFAFGCDSVAFMRPLDEAIPLYKELGFQFLLTQRRIPCCVRRIG